MEAEILNPQSKIFKQRKAIRKNLQAQLQTLQKNQLNSSKSKMQFTFSKSDRFQSTILSSSPNKFYDLPPVKTMRSSSFGYGNKTDFGKNGKFTPAPGAYELQSSFKSNKKLGASMALSRQEVKFNGIFNNKNPDSPAPSSYLVNSKYITPKYSIGKRFSFNMNKWIQQVPGPGNYNHEQPTGNLKSSISNFMSPPSTKFPKTQRLKQPLQNNIQMPGPGNYQVIKQFYNKKGTIIGKGDRISLQRKMFTPGPGTYDVFSQFLK